MFRKKGEREGILMMIDYEFQSIRGKVLENGGGLGDRSETGMERPCGDDSLGDEGQPSGLAS